MCKTRVVLLVLLSLSLPAFSQQTQSRAAFREKIIEAVQTVDGVDPLSSELAYTLDHMNARSAVMSAVRLASTEQELKATDALLAWIQWLNIARQASHDGRSKDFKNVLDRDTELRGKCLEAAGLTEQNIYPHSKDWGKEPPIDMPELSGK